MKGHIKGGVASLHHGSSIHTWVRTYNKHLIGNLKQFKI